MGHSSIEVTLNQYGHLFPNADQAPADSMEARRAAYQDRLKKRLYRYRLGGAPLFLPSPTGTA